MFKVQYKHLKKLNSVEHMLKFIGGQRIHLISWHIRMGRRTVPWVVKCLFVCLMVFNATFNNISVKSWRQFYWCRKPEDLEKTTDLSPVTDKLYQIMLYCDLALIKIRTHNISGDRHGKFNYCMITATTVPLSGKTSRQWRLNIELWDTDVRWYSTVRDIAW
jgi:hypothetical protein